MPTQPMGVSPVPGRDLPPPPGLTLTDTGAEFAVRASEATAVELCLFDAAGERRIKLTQRVHGWWWDVIPGVRVGQRYGIRVDGPWDPAAGLRHNPNKLLLDPYARALEGEVRLGPEVYAHTVHPDLTWDVQDRSPLDSAGHVPRCVVVDGDFDWGGDALPRTAWADSVIYEVHVKNATARHPGIPPELRGTYAGLAHPAMIDHLHRLGVTTVELLPVHTKTTEPEVTRRGLTNHWGYNTLGYFSPHAGYAAARDPQGVLDEFKGMVKLLHAAGIEVLLDVVYNHTAEQSVTGPTFSWRGLDPLTYYRLDDNGHDIDVTGCGNTVNVHHPVTARMILDSLRYWVEECHVDGFRFDLAVALGRGREHDYDADVALHVVLQSDPVLSRTKLVAEPWDLGPGGWRTGQFPPPFREWNDRFRDTTRTFWLTDVHGLEEGRSGHGVQELATRLVGSQDLFHAGDRGPLASVNFVCAHDGFTVADTTAFDHKHNEANGEGNRDGANVTRSWNHGVEGWSTASPSIHARRRRSIRNLLATMLLSVGVPMINGGDEFGRTQGGNNNPYCLDVPQMWFDWELEPWQQDLIDTTAHLVALRSEHPVLRNRTFFTGAAVDPDGSLDLAWFDESGAAMNNDDWHGGDVRVLQVLFDGAAIGSRSVHLVINGGIGPATVTLPQVPGLTAYRLLWDSTDERPSGPGERITPRTVEVGPTSMQVYCSVDPT